MAPTHEGVGGRGCGTPSECIDLCATLIAGGRLISWETLSWSGWGDCRCCGSGVVDDRPWSWRFTEATGGLYLEDMTCKGASSFMSAHDEDGARQLALNLLLPVEPNEPDASVPLALLRT